MLHARGIEAREAGSVDTSPLPKRTDIVVVPMSSDDFVEWLVDTTVNRLVERQRKWEARKRE